MSNGQCIANLHDFFKVQGGLEDDNAKPLFALEILNARTYQDYKLLNGIQTQL